MKHFSTCRSRPTSSLSYLCAVALFGVASFFSQAAQAQNGTSSTRSTAQIVQNALDARLQTYTKSSAQSRATGNDRVDLSESTTTAQTLGDLPIDLKLVRRIKVAGTVVNEAPVRVSNLDILAPIVGDESSLLTKLGATASRVSEKNYPGNLNTPTETQSFQLNLAPRPPIILTVGRATAYIDGQEQQLRAAPLLINGKIYLPIFSIAPLLGAAVRLESDGTLNITPTVQSVEVFSASGYTVVTVKTSAPIPIGAILKGTLDNPPKLYFDFAGYSMGFDATNSTNERIVSPGLNDIAQVRAGMPQKFPDITRVALDLKRDIAGKATIQPLPDKTLFAILIPTTQPKTSPRDVKIPGPDEPRVPTSGGTLRGLTIVIDAGHGGHDSGAPGSALLGSSTGLRGISPGVTRSAEKIYNLDIAQRLRANLEARGATVLMTRDSDVFIPLQGRVDFANARHADIFFSIHIDSFLRSSSGTTTHFWTAQSQPLAREVQNELARATGLKSRGVMQSRFFVIRKTWMPSVLTESCFITNPGEEAKLMNPNWRQRVANGMAQGIVNYVARYGVRY